MELNLPHHDVLLAEFTGGWLTLTMHDPARRNALSDAMARALNETLDAVADNRSVRGITLRGSDGVFCSGGDLKGMAQHIAAKDREAIVALSKNGGELFAKLNNQPQFILALIDGPAMAGGLGLACCADMVGVTSKARFALTEARLGIPPAQIAPYVVARIGLRATRQLMLTAASFGSDEAVAFGVADHQSQDTQLLEKWALSIQGDVLQTAPGAIAATKKMALKAAHAAPETLMEEAAHLFTDCLLSDEGMEGIASFVGKRKPRWADNG